MKLKEDLVLRNIGKDHIIVVPETDRLDMSRVYTLNEAAAWLWEQLKDRHFSINMVADMLYEQYEVSLEQAQKDAIALIETFKKNGLLSLK